MHREPCSLRTLCVIARRLLTDDPAIDDSEWRERIKCALITQGWTYPRDPELIGEAMKRVERDIERPVPVPPGPGWDGAKEARTRVAAIVVRAPRQWPVYLAGGSDRGDQETAMTALEKLTMSRLEDRVTMLDATVQELVGRVELLEQVTWATADACGALLVRVEELERSKEA